jgi:hypothetical protein
VNVWPGLAMLVLLALLAWLSDARSETAMVPPAKYDHAFAGKVSVTGGTESQTRASCRMFAPYGCSTLLTPTHCAVYAVAAGRSAGGQVITAAFHAAIVRHEVGHCNGWPAHHPYARFLKGL